MATIYEHAAIPIKPNDLPGDESKTNKSNSNTKTQISRPKQRSPGLNKLYGHGKFRHNYHENHSTKQQPISPDLLQSRRSKSTSVAPKKRSILGNKKYVMSIGALTLLLGISVAYYYHLKPRHEAMPETAAAVGNLQSTRRSSTLYYPAQLPAGFSITSTVTEPTPGVQEYIIATTKGLSIHVTQQRSPHIYYIFDEEF